MIGLSELTREAYRVTRDTLRVLLRCLLPWNAKAYCLKCNVPPVFPGEDWTDTLVEVEQHADDPGVNTADDLAKLLGILEHVVTVLATSGDWGDRALAYGLKLALPAAIYAVKERRGAGHTAWLVLMLVSLLDQRLQEAYPNTLASERLARIFFDGLNGALFRSNQDEGGSSGQQLDILVAALWAAGVGVLSFELADWEDLTFPYLDFGFDHPQIPGLEEPRDCAQHAFTAFYDFSQPLLQQSDYAAFEPEGAPFRQRPLAFSFVPLIRSAASVPAGATHGGGLWIQGNGRYTLAPREKANPRVSLELDLGGGGLMPNSQPLDEAFAGSLKGTFDFTWDDPSAATWDKESVPEGVSVRARRVALHLEAKAGGSLLAEGAAKEFDVAGFARVEGAELVVGRLPVIEFLMPSGFRLAFDAGLVGSLRRKELHFEGGLATEIVIPVNRAVAARFPSGTNTLFSATLRTITIKLAARTAQGQPSPGEPAPRESGKFAFSATASLEINLGGALIAQAEGLGASYSLEAAPEMDGNAAGLAKSGWDFLWPTGIGLTIKIGALRGGGFLGYDEAHRRLFGALSVEIPKLAALKGIGVCEPRPDGTGHSWMAVACLEFKRSGGAITLIGVGLLYGSNRRSDPQAFLDGLSAGDLDALVLPGDPVEKAAVYTAAIGKLFPPSQDGEVFGIVLKVGALGGRLNVALGLIMDDGGSGGASKTYVVLTVLATFPTKTLATIRIEAAGVAIWDAATDEFSLRIVLRNSKLFGGELTGEASAFSGDPDLSDQDTHHTWLVSFGGFHPRFQVPGNRIYVPKPLQMTFASGDHLKIEWRLYFAVTTGSIQFGVSVDLKARFAGFGIRGRLALDLVVSFSPFRFEADVTATVEVSLGSRTLAGIAFKGTLSGFYPAELTGRVSVKFLKDDDEQLDVTPLLVSSVTDVRNWDTGGAPGLALRPAERAGVWLSPSEPLTFRQAVVPLERTVTRCGSASLPAPTVFTIEPVAAQGAIWQRRGVDGEFAPGLYVELSQEESLSAASFVSMPAGFAIDRPFERGASVDSSLDYELVIIDSANPKPTVDPKRKFPAAVIDAAFQCAPSLAESSRRSAARPVALSSDRFAIVTASLAPVAVSLDYLQALAGVRSGAAQRLVPAVEAA